MIRGWAYRRWVSVIIGLAVGAVAGLAVYQGSQLKGQSLYILCGTTAGGVAATVIYGFRRSVQLAEITLSVPQFTSMKFAVTKTNRVVAWKLFVEATTRVSLQPLGAEAGVLREAMTSLYLLFTNTRQTLAAAEPSIKAGDTPTVEHLAIAMLNKELRPFLATWHPRLRAWELEHPEAPEKDWPANAQCRQDLAGVQRNLIRYTASFGELSGVSNIREILEGPLTWVPPDEKAQPQ
jgi:hypothetical protein